MAFWDSVKDSVKKAATSTKCLAGMHAGVFEPAAGKPKCNMEKVCPDCNKRLEKIEHKFGKFEYTRARNCEGKFVCVHCQHEDVKVKHEWVTETSRCDTYRQCSRCHTKEHLRTNHKWHGGVAHPNGTQTFFCSGCDATERRPFDVNS